MSDAPHGTIGIVGGLGPHAGVDLCRRLLAETRADRDQDHLPVVMASRPATGDRSEFLLDRTLPNPGLEIADDVRRLAGAGATVIGIPCNTAHAEPILAPVLQAVRDEGLELVHMVRATARAVAELLPAGAQVGILGTNGTITSGVYRTALTEVGLLATDPDPHSQRSRVHPAIYDPQYGLKATGAPVSARAAAQLESVLCSLVDNGCRAVVLACTELPLVGALMRSADVTVIDATRVLARALISRVDPGSLRPDR